MAIKVEYNETYDEWDIDSKEPHWVHAARSTRKEAVQLARQYAIDGEDIKVKGPRMSSFKTI